MKKFIFMMGIISLVYCATACKSSSIGKSTDSTVSVGDNSQNAPAEVNNPLVEKYWKLVELMGEPVAAGESGKEPFLILKAHENRANGNFGCNTFVGSYELGVENRIKFSQLASTMMMCPNMEIEGKFSEVLKMTDSYYIDGDNLTLNRARMAPLAKFVAVYL